MARNKDPAPIGSGALAAFLRQGLKEVGAALKPLPDSIQIDELGSLGNRVTPQEVFADKHDLSPHRTLDFDMDR